MGRDTQKWRYAQWKLSVILRLVKQLGQKAMVGRYRLKRGKLVTAPLIKFTLLVKTFLTMKMVSFGNFVHHVKLKSNPYAHFYD